MNLILTILKVVLLPIAKEQEVGRERPDVWMEETCQLAFKE